MSDNYYKLKHEEMIKLQEAEAFEEALALVDEELSMPYIPQAYLSIFKQLKKELSQTLKLNQPVPILHDPDQIREHLQKDEMHQLKALDALSKLNMRAHPDLVQTAFELIEDRLLISLLIRLCIEQAITQEYTFTSEGLTYTFIPAALILPEDSEGVEGAKDLLIEWLEKEPSLLKLCLEQLEVTSLLKLPQSYDADEAQDLAFEVLEPIYSQIKDKESFNGLKASILEENEHLSSTH